MSVMSLTSDDSDFEIFHDSELTRSIDTPYSRKINRFQITSSKYLRRSQGLCARMMENISNRTSELSIIDYVYLMRGIIDRTKRLYSRGKALCKKKIVSDIDTANIATIHATLNEMIQAYNETTDYFMNNVGFIYLTDDKKSKVA